MCPRGCICHSPNLHLAGFKSAAMVKTLTLVPPGKVTNRRFGLSLLWAPMTFCSMRRFVATSSMSSSMAVNTADKAY